MKHIAVINGWDVHRIGPNRWHVVSPNTDVFEVKLRTKSARKVVEHVKSRIAVGDPKFRV